MLFWVIMISNDRKNCVNLDLFIDKISIYHLYSYSNSLCLQTFDCSNYYMVNVYSALLLHA